MRIATFGDINVDVILSVDRLPSPGEEVFSTSRTEILGGSAVNTGVVLSRLGHDVSVMGATGGDDPGRRALSWLEALGISTHLTSKTDTHPTAMNTILVTPDGERTMIGARGANVTYPGSPGWDRDIDWLHFSGYALREGAQLETALDAIEVATHSGIRTSLDVPMGVGSQVGEAVSERLGAFTLVAGSRLSLSEVTKSERPVDSLVSSGVGRVAVTSGPDPLLLANHEGEVRVTPPRVEPVDATGAGDALMAGLIAASLASLELGPSAVLGALAGAAATLVPGASETLANADIWRFLLEPSQWTDAKADWVSAVSTLIG